MYSGTIVKDMPPEEAGFEEQQAEQQRQSELLSAAVHQQTSPLAAATTPSQATSNAVQSNPWVYEDLSNHCVSCGDEFHPLNRKHHCRKCGNIFCGKCSNQRCLIPPSAIVLVPQGGKKAKASELNHHQNISFSPDPDPDRMLTYLAEESDGGLGFNEYSTIGGGGSSSALTQQQQVLYGKGLEERFQLAREPLRVCAPCWTELQPLQEELRLSNSNAMRFNHIDPHSALRNFNSPLAFTLGHEVRKAAYTLNNLLPLPRRAGAGGNNSSFFISDEITPNSHAKELQECRDTCQTLQPTLGGLDGVQIPAKLLEAAKGVATLTVCKGGFGLAGVEFGTGLVVARLGSNQWSAPCAIGTVGMSWGALVGAQVSDHVFLLMTDQAVEMMFASNGSVQLGADVGVAVGPLGRTVEADLGASPGNLAPIYTYSLSKGLYAGVSLDGKVIVTRHRVNEKFYGRPVSGMELLQGVIPTPPAARPLYDALARCHVYATGNLPVQSRIPSTPQQLQPVQDPYGGEYGEFPYRNNLGSPDAGPPDQHSYAGMSDITSDPGY